MQQLFSWLNIKLYFHIILALLFRIKVGSNSTFSAPMYWMSFSNLISELRFCC